MISGGKPDAVYLPMRLVDCKHVRFDGLLFSFIGPMRISSEVKIRIHVSNFTCDIVPLKSLKKNRTRRISIGIQFILLFSIRFTVIQFIKHAILFICLIHICSYMLVLFVCLPRRSSNPALIVRYGSYLPIPEIFGNPPLIPGNPPKKFGSPPDKPGNPPERSGSPLVRSGSPLDPPPLPFDWAIRDTRCTIETLKFTYFRQKLQNMNSKTYAWL